MLKGNVMGTLCRTYYHGHKPSGDYQEVQYGVIVYPITGIIILILILLVGCSVDYTLHFVWVVG